MIKNGELYVSPTTYVFTYNLYTLHQIECSLMMLACGQKEINWIRICNIYRVLGAHQSFPGGNTGEDIFKIRIRWGCVKYGSTSFAITFASHRIHEAMQFTHMQFCSFFFFCYLEYSILLKAQIFVFDSSVIFFEFA